MLLTRLYPRQKLKTTFPSREPVPNKNAIGPVCLCWSQISKGNNRLAPAWRSLGAEPSNAGSRSIQNSTPANSLTVKSRENNWPFRIFARFSFGQVAMR